MPRRSPALSGMRASPSQVQLLCRVLSQRCCRGLLVVPKARSCSSVRTCPVGFQVTMCDQLTHYLNKFVAAAAPAAAHGPAAGEVAAIDGYKVLLSHACCSPLRIS